MSLAYLNAAWKANCPTLTEKFVLVAIAKHAANETGKAFPSISRLAEMCCMTERCVYKAIKKLEAAGLIVVGTGGGKGNRNVYTLCLNPEQHSVNGVHPLNNVQSNPEPGSVVQYKGTKNELRGPRFESHVREDIRETKDRMEALKLRWSLWNSMEGTRWTNAEKHREYLALKARLSHLDAQLFRAAVN